MYRELKTITSVDVIKSVKAHIADDRKNLKIFNMLAETFKPFEGKKVTKRMCNAAIKDHGAEYDFSWRYQYGWYEIAIKPKGSKFDMYIDFMIARESDFKSGQETIFQQKRFEYHCACAHEAAKERIKKNELFLATAGNVHEVVRKVNAMVRAKQAYKDIEDFGGWYDVQKKAGLYE